MIVGPVPAHDRPQEQGAGKRDRRPPVRVSPVPEDTVEVAEDGAAAALERHEPLAGTPGRNAAGPGRHARPLARVAAARRLAEREAEAPGSIDVVA